MIKIPPPPTVPETGPALTLRRQVAGGLALVVLLALAFSAGRFTAPEQVREVEKIAWKERAAEKKAEAKTKVVDRVVYVDRVVTAQGEVREKRTTRTLTDARELAEVSKTTESSGSAEKSTVTTLRPDWRVGVLAGASLREPLVPLAGPLVIGVEVERRILGGVSAGVWANTSGAAGALVSVEF